MPGAHIVSGTPLLYLIALVMATVLLTLPGCTKQIEGEDYVARVGNEILTLAEINRLLENTSAFLDSSDAVSQIVEQWITNELLFQEAVSRGLKGDPSVQRLLADNERSVLINALVNRMAATEMGAGPGDSSIRSYYDQNRDQLALREPFVRVRHLVFVDPDSADSVRTILQSLAGEPEETPVLLDLNSRYSSGGPELNSYYPQSQLFARIPGLTEAVNSIEPGEVLPLFAHEDAFHLIQLIDRVPAGTVPSLDMIADELRDRVAIKMRKQLFARQVQRLRTRALSRDDLEIR